MKKYFISGLIILFIILPEAVFAQDQMDALELYRIGEYQKAVEVCRQELEEKPNLMDAWTILGWCQLKLKTYDQALEIAEKALQISRYDPRIIEIAGEALLYLGRRKEALKYFEEYAAIAPTGDRIENVYYFMGEIFIQQGKFNNADIAISTALYHSPNVAAWWARLGYAREKNSDYKWSLEAYDKALALNPNLIDAKRGKLRIEQHMSGE